MWPSPEVPVAPKSTLPSPSHSKLHGFQLFARQLSALLKKNFLLSLRGKRATFAQLFSSLVFIFLIFCVDRAVTARRKNTSGFSNLVDPESKFVTAIPACETGYYIKTPCYDFIWSGSGISRASTIVENIRNNNPGRLIPASKVLSFEALEDVNRWLLANPMHTTGALHFLNRSSSVIAYGIQTNSTTKNERGIYEDPTFTFQVPLQLAAEREITRVLTGDSSIEWSVAFKEFAHPNLETFSVAGRVGALFLFAASMFGFVVQMSSLVAERESRLRQAMSIMGLLDSAYWLSWLLWEVVLVFVSSILIVLFGMMFQFYLFLHNSFGVIFFLFFLFQFNLIGFAFLLSTFLSSSGSARTVGFGVFIIGFLAQLVTAFGFPYDEDFAKTFQVIWSVFPPNLLAIGLQYLGDATSTKEAEGISWGGRARCSAANPDCVITMEQIYKWLTATFFVWFFLALYFDNVLKDVNGVSKPWYYFLLPSYWTGRASSQADKGACCCNGSVAIPLESTAVDEDVVAEEQFVRDQAAGPYDPNIAVEVCGLMKTFQGTRECCRCRRSPPFHAVKDLWVHMEKDKLFCLLGPNGAGKTTTINCLTGIVPVSGGDALVYGESIRNTQGIANIRSYMGVCPQFDVLWDALTGLEHVYLFASIKGLPSSLEKQMATELLSQVRLEKDMNARAGSYSGGMKRRLSVAIALIGDPKIVYLDEPTTGMDPITRRHVWDIIEGAKKGRAIILTTHSMEEADILSDRIAIMAKGKLRCIGTSLYLKSRFGAGYIVSVSLIRKVNGKSSPEGDVHANHVKSFFKEKLEVEPKEETANFLTYIIPKEREDQLMNFFDELQDKQAEFGIADIQMSLTTLEEVFLNIAKQAELESAAEEGRFEMVLLPDGTSLRVPIGATFVTVPNSEMEEHPQGMMIKLDWQQDESGRLCLARQSDLMPLSPSSEHVEGVVPVSSRGSFRNGSSRNSSGRVSV
ncbi:hypothetical protein L7F22_051080 [Adiantum nelumboides]|nr:hypothetical protein [Adiantum nelumboides]